MTSQSIHGSFLFIYLLNILNFWYYDEPLKRDKWFVKTQRLGQLWLSKYKKALFYFFLTHHLIQ